MDRSIWPVPSSALVFAERRRRLRERFRGVGCVTSGLPRPRNYPAQLYPFRAESHFAYLVGAHPAGAVLRISPTEDTLFVAPPDPESALWSGPAPTLAELEQSLGFSVRPLTEFRPELAQAVIPSPDAGTTLWLESLMARTIGKTGQYPLEGNTLALAEALIACRLHHDAAAIFQIRQAAAATAEAHRRAMARTQPGLREAHVRATLEATAVECGMGLAYGPIVSQRGEVLHQEESRDILQSDALLLVDFGVETPEGWAADVTRTWPVNGRFSPTQRAVYEVVLAAQLVAVQAIGPGVRYREVHRLATDALTRGLLEIGIFSGTLQELKEAQAGSLFFPHGIGHLLGLDVHDLEDLGDLAGYGPGRQRSSLRGERYLRLDRDLEAGMVVTVEPGFYQIAGILQDPHQLGALASLINWEVLARFRDVRGIRIEDDILVTSTGNENLTRNIPKSVQAIEGSVGIQGVDPRTDWFQDDSPPGFSR